MAFLQEFEILKKKFPKRSTLIISSENCEWGDHVWNSVNCYKVFDSSGLNGCMYVNDSFKETDCVDSLWNGFCEHCYEVSDSIESNNCYYCQYLARCYNMWYSFRCNDCHDCFGCVNLSNKEYCIFNVQHTKEEYQAMLPELKKMPAKEALAKALDLLHKFPLVQSNFSDNTNSDYCDYVYKSTNAYYCFDSNSLTDCSYLNNSNENQDVWDASYVFKCENSVEICNCDECYNCYNCERCERCYDSYFLYNCADCHDCFGCVGLTNKQYCILNVQYTKEEYLAKLAELKNELGLHFKEAQTA